MTSIIVSYGLYPALNTIIQKYTKDLPDNEIYKTIRELDIINRVELINSVLNKINDNDETITLAVGIINKTLSKMNLLLANVHNKLKFHDTLWFKSYRQLKISRELEEIKIQSEILDKQFKLLLDISLFMKCII